MICDNISNSYLTLLRLKLNAMSGTECIVYHLKAGGKARELNVETSTPTYRLDGK